MLGFFILYKIEQENELEKNKGIFCQGKTSS
jgi:hypothetical protein